MPRRGDPLKKTLFPLDVIVYSSAKFGRFKSNYMTEGKWPRGPALLDWGDLCHVWGFTGFKLELELHGRRWADALLSWLITTKPRQGATFQTKPRPRQKLWGRAEAVRLRPRQDHVRPSQLKKLPRGRLEPRQMLRGLHPEYHASMLQIDASFFLSISRAVCYRMMNWKKGIELALNYWMKRLWKALNFVVLLAHEPWISHKVWLC